MKKKLTDEEISNILINFYPGSNNIDIFRVKYKNNKIRLKVRFICGVCGTYNEAFFDNVKKGKACSGCGRKKAILNSRKKYSIEFIEEELLKRNFKWINKEYYKDASSGLKTECMVCGHISIANATNRINENRGCAKCLGLIKKSINEVREEIEILGKGEYELLSTKYVKAERLLDVMHKTCGYKYKVSRSNFRKGRRCPSCNISKGEQKISDFMISQNIIFEREKEFPGLVGINGGNLRYDFFIPEKNILIEYDGELHYMETTKGNNLIRQQEHDKRKDEYAKRYGWKLIRIPYWEFDNIEKILSSII